MNPKEFANKMKDIAKEDDKETRHCHADALMCVMLRNLGYGKGIDVYDEIEMWYA